MIAIEEFQHVQNNAVQLTTRTKKTNHYSVWPSLASSEMSIPAASLCIQGSPWTSTRRYHGIYLALCPDQFPALRNVHVVKLHPIRQKRVVNDTLTRQFLCFGIHSHSIWETQKHQFKSNLKTSLITCALSFWLVIV